MKAIPITIIVTIFIMGAISAPTLNLSKITAALKDDTLTISFSVSN